MQNPILHFEINCLMLVLNSHNFDAISSKIELQATNSRILIWKKFSGTSKII